MRAPLLALTLLSACTADPKATEPATGDAGDTGDTGDTDAVDPLAWAVDDAGPYRLGYQQVETTYTTALGDTRTIPVHVWYPTEDTTGEEVRYEGLFAHDSALGGAASAPPVHAGGYPVLVHSHGHWGVAGGVAYWAERLVSQGWVVAAPEHVGNTFQDGFPDFSEPSPTVHYIHRPEDVSAALDRVAQGDLFAGPAQSEAAALSGHSRGGYTAWTAAGASFDGDMLAAACAGENDAFPTGACTPEEQAVFQSGELSDPRFQAAVVLDASIRDIFGDEGHASVHAPFLSLRHADTDGTGQADFDRMAPVDYTWVAVEGACHETFNIGIEASTFQPCETFEVDRGWDLTATYVLAFVRNRLQGDTDPDVVGILDGSVEVDAAAVLQRR